LRWNQQLEDYLRGLSQAGKGIVLCGDLNVAHKEIDIHSPETHQMSSGFTKEEREGFTSLLSSVDFVDVYRKEHPETTAYTFWSYRGRARENDRGWRLDYFLVQRMILDRVLSSWIEKEVKGSDHCPVGLLFKN